ncbi:MAG: hypothetical protein IT449_14185 [Phycisphaerales bacterium]|nr:hypothetical protein [Phycisphaerales bacterium]
MTCRGVVNKGVIILDAGAILPDGAVVEVVVLPDREAEPSPTLYDTLQDVIGIADGLPVDLAENHDHYLYGTPRK